MGFAAVSPVRGKVMTPKEAKIAFKALAKEIGIKADVLLSFGYGKPALSVSIYPSGIASANHNRYFQVDAEDFQELFDASVAKWAEYRDRHRSQIIREMALAIIRTTASLGECTDAALRNEFHAGDIAQYGKDACEDANTIAGKGPFTIKTKGGANNLDNEAA
jgi:hypothetical protein